MSYTGGAGERESHTTVKEVDITLLQYQTILKEVFTADYNITEEEVGEYCQVVGIDAGREPQLLPLARAALLHPLPPHWTPVEDSHLGLYFYNQETGESRWTHPVDTIVRSLLTRHRSTTSTDSYSEEFDTEEDQLISEFLRAQVSEQEASHSGSDDLDHHTHPDLIPSSKHCSSVQDVPHNPVKICQPQDNISGSDEGRVTDKSHTAFSSSLVPADREVKCVDIKREIKVNVIEGKFSSTVDNNDVSNNQSLVRKEDDNDMRQRKEGTECEERQESEVGGSIPAATSPSSAPAPSMFGGRDSLGRSLGRSPLGPPLLGTPNSLATPPLGRPVLGGPPKTSAPVPPIGGQLTPLVPIAAAGRGGHTHLAPLKPLGPSPRSPQHQGTREGHINPPLRRQPAQKDGQVWGGERGSGGPERQAEGIRGPVRGEGDGALGSPPKSILKGPVLVSGVAASKGIDRMSFMERKESKNLRFDFTTGDIDYHTSEEEFEEEELGEEELGEEEEEYEDEEEFDSEAEDPEEEAMLIATGVLDDDSEGGGIVLNDASDLLPQRPGSSFTRPGSSLIRPGSLHPPQYIPHGSDPWANEELGNPPPGGKTIHHDPLKMFRMERDKDRSKTCPEKKDVKPEASPVKSEVGEAQVKVNKEHSKAPPETNSGSQVKPIIPKSQQLTIIKNASAETNVGNLRNISSQDKALSVGKAPSDVKQATQPPEERKLELEGPPKTRKINPLDRVVAKLSGRTDGNNQSASSHIVDNVAPTSRGVVKNLTVNLTELMNKADEEIEDEDTDSTVPGGDNDEDETVLRKQQDAEEKRLRDHNVSLLKSLRDNLNEDYKAKEEKIRNEHKNALIKFEEQEKQKLEQRRKQIQIDLTQKNEKLIEKAKSEMEKNFAEMKNKLVKDLEKVNEEEVEEVKIKYVQEMQKTKERLQQEHSEEVEELEQELKALYSQQKSAKQQELDAQKASVASRNSKESAAAVVEELEQSMAEILREKQRDLRREHNKQISVLSDELDKELEKAARQAKDKETQEKKKHAANLTKMKQEHVKEVKQCEESYEQDLQDLETEHEKDLSRLAAQFKAELTQQKTELENKLMEFRLEYEQKMSCLEDENEMEEHEDNHVEEIPEIRKNPEQKGDLPKCSINHKDKAVSDESIIEQNRGLYESEKKYNDVLKQLRERRKVLEEDLEELKAQETKVKELRIQRPASCTSHSPCPSNVTCIHASKYQKMKDKYSTLVSRIKSEKAKRSSKRHASSHIPIIHTTPSFSSDKSSLDSSANVSDNNDVTSSISSPQHPVPLRMPTCSSSIVDVSEDEDIKLANQVLRKYGKNIDYASPKKLPLFTKPLISSTPKKAWADDQLLAHGKKELKKTEKFLNSSILKHHHATRDLDVDEIHKEILWQNASFQTPSSKRACRRLSLAPDGSLTSDTESDDPNQDLAQDPSQDPLITTPDFGLDTLLGQLSSANRPVLREARNPSTGRRKTQPLRAAASLERGLDNITQPLTTYAARYSLVSPSAPLGLKHFNSGSVPDLGPDTVDRIASVNQYLQQRWTSYFGELSVPLGGKVGWPSKVIGQSTLLGNKSSADNVLINNNVHPLKSSSLVHDKSPLKSHNLKEDVNINQKIDDLRAWLEKAQATSAAVAAEKVGQTGRL